MQRIVPIRNILQHWVSIQTQIVLDHTVGNLLWHLVFRHLILWQILGCEFASIDGGSESVGIGRSFHAQPIETLYQRSLDVLI